MLFRLIEKNRVIEQSLEMGILVPGKAVVRYHANTDSENDENFSSSESSDSFEESFDRSNKRQRKTKPIIIKDNEMTSRYSRCLKCKKRFDVTRNERGDCVWHDGTCSNLI
jgi:hypothetical protein